MKIGSINRERHAASMQDELDRMVGTIRRTWRSEHTDEGGHGAVTATSFAGPLTGNVTGNLTGNMTGNADGAQTLSDGPWLMNGSAVISPTALGAATDNWGPANLATAVLIRASASGAARNLTGIVAQPDGTLLCLLNVGGTNNIVLVHNASSTAANRFYCPGAGDFTLLPYQGVWLRYDGTLNRWTLLAS